MNVRFLVFLPSKTRRSLSKAVKNNIKLASWSHTRRLLAVVRAHLGLRVKQQNAQGGLTAHRGLRQGARLRNHRINTGWQDRFNVWPAHCVLRERVAIVPSTCLPTFQSLSGSHGPDCPPIPANHHVPGSWRDGCVALEGQHPGDTSQACPGGFFPFRLCPMVKLCPLAPGFR